MSKKEKSRSPLTEISSLSAAEHIMQHRPDRIDHIQIHSKDLKVGSRLDHLINSAKKKNIRINFSHQLKGGTPLRVMIHAYPYKTLEGILPLDEKTQTSFILMLDHLQDPQNFGAICRSADALGVSAIVIPKDRSVIVSSGVYHASVGAVETIPIARVTNLAQSIRKLKDHSYWIIGSAAGKNFPPPWEGPDFKRVVLLVGGELEGIHPALEKLCDWRTEIPMMGRVQSLNVSVACALLIHEIRRRMGSG